jgi:O-antigen ligase
MESSVKVIARYLALGALFAIPVVPIIVANGFFFPFITGKAFFFRVMVEIAVAAWLVLAFVDRRYRPRFSWLGVLVLAFVAWMFLADALAVNVTKAFWSNFERMEGWVLLAHLAAFFGAASAVLGAERKWRAWFLTSLAVSLYVCAYALLQLSGALAIHQGASRIDASLGNSAYLAIYLLFNVFIAGWLALSEARLGWKWSLIALAALEAVLIFFTGTRGAILGLVGALALAALLTALTGSRRARGYALAGLAAIVVLAGAFYLARDSSFVARNYALERVASISLADGETRFRIWHIAWQGFLERPIVGWGQEGFNYVFNEHYDPALYGQEPWFDRAHNAFIDWLMAGGAPAFLLFLALFGTTVVLLWRRSELSRAERIALTAALAGYAVHNLFVFDNLYSYIYFFAVLALVHSQVARPVRRLEDAPEFDEARASAVIVPVATVMGIALIWLVNVPGIGAATGLVAAISPLPEGVSGNLARFKELEDAPPFARQEIREQLVSIATAVAEDSTVAADVREGAVTSAVAAMQAQVAEHPRDTRGYLELAYAYRAAGDLDNALAATLKAAELTPTKEDIWITAGALAWDKGAMPQVTEYFAKALALSPGNKELAQYAAAGEYAAGDTAEGDRILLDAYGTTTVDSQILAAAYYRAQRWDRLIRLWEARAARSDANGQTYLSLAAAHYAAGDRAVAIAIIQDTIARFPETKAAGEAALKEIQGATR